jgi:hypothetical protein
MRKGYSTDDISLLLMPLDPVKLIGIMIREASPMFMQYYRLTQDEHVIQKTEALTNENFTRMKLTLLEKQVEQLKEYCPACRMSNVKKEVGHETWLLLHRTADNYPKEPTEEERIRFKTFIDSVITNFPCSYCVQHALQYLREHPLDYTSKDTLRYSMCQFHNFVNRSLNKQEYPCS